MKRRKRRKIVLGNSVLVAATAAAEELQQKVMTRVRNRNKICGEENPGEIMHPSPKVPN